jgi:hypothetical protein
VKIKIKRAPVAGRPTPWSKRELSSGVETRAFYADENGEYTPERQALHDELVDQQLNGHADQEEPHLTLTSGGTASGKSDAARKAQEEMRDCVYVNTDEMRALLPEFSLVEGTDKAGLLQEEAGDVRDQLLAGAVVSKMNVIWDAPGSPRVADHLNEIQKRGYRVTIAYTHRPVEEAKAAAVYRAKHASNRADRRVVPDTVIEDSHRKARAGFGAMAAIPGREVIIYDKTGKPRGAPADVIYHRTAMGEVQVYDEGRVRHFATGAKPQIDESVF